MNKQFFIIRNRMFMAVWALCDDLYHILYDISFDKLENQGTIN